MLLLLPIPFPTVLHQPPAGCACKLSKSLDMSSFRNMVATVALCSQGPSLICHSQRGRSLGGLCLPQTGPKYDIFIQKHWIKNTVSLFTMFFMIISGETGVCVLRVSGFIASSYICTHQVHRWICAMHRFRIFITICPSNRYNYQI